MTINNLRDSANGTFVTLDDYLSLTGYEPNAMEFTNDTELNDAISSDFIDFEDSLVHVAVFTLRRTATLLKFIRVKHL